VTPDTAPRARRPTHVFDLSQPAVAGSSHDRFQHSGPPHRATLAAAAVVAAAALGACRRGGDAAAAPADSAAGAPGGGGRRRRPSRRPRERGARRARAHLERPRAQRLAHPRALGDAARPGGGTITAVYAEAGQAVRRGQPLARVETTGIAEQAVSARAGVAAARNSFELAARNADRAERLLAAGAIASRDAEQARSAATGARSQLSTAQAQLALAQRSSATPPPPRRSPASSARAR
jgi:multidrug efflux pump subunit AcrA (membrane-fusion protein)